MEVDLNVDTNFEFTKRKRGTSVSSAMTDASMKSKRSSKGGKRRKIPTASETKERVRKIPVPAHRYTPLKEHWMKIYMPLTEHLRLQVRFNLKTRNVELKMPDGMEDESQLQKGADFVKAFVLGFDVEDALALLRLDQLFIETFDIKDVKMLKGDHLSRAVGRLAGKGGKIKHTIENATKTRIVLADTRIHILGSYNSVQIARRPICNLIMGLPPSTVFAQLKNVQQVISQRM